MDTNASNSQKLRMAAKLILEVANDIDKKESDLITLGEASEIAKVSKIQIMRWASAGKIEIFKASARKLYLSKNDFLAFMKSNKWNTDTQNHESNM